MEMDEKLKEFFIEKFSSINRSKIVETETDTERKIRVIAIRGSESTYVSELVVEQEVLGALADLVFLPTDELGLERLEHGGG